MASSGVDTDGLPFLPKASNFCTVRAIRFCSNVISMWSIKVSVCNGNIKCTCFVFVFVFCFVLFCRENKTVEEYLLEKDCVSSLVFQSFLGFQLSWNKGTLLRRSQIYLYVTFKNMAARSYRDTQGVKREQIPSINSLNFLYTLYSKPSKHPHVDKTKNKKAIEGNIIKTT